MKNKFSIFIFLLFAFNANSATLEDIGEKGDPNNYDRLVKISMYDNYFEPNTIKVKKGETIRFIVTNNGDLVHEYNIGTKQMHRDHEMEMQKLIDHEIIVIDKIDKDKMKKMSKKDHSLAHSHYNSLMLEPNETGELTWKFNKNTVLEIACNIPGHYESGMIAKILID